MLTDITPEDLANTICLMLSETEIISGNGTENYIKNVKVIGKHPKYLENPVQLLITFTTESKMKITVTPILTDENCLLPNGEKHPGWHIY